MAGRERERIGEHMKRRSSDRDRENMGKWRQCWNGVSGKAVNMAANETGIRNEKAWSLSPYLDMVSSPM